MSKKRFMALLLTLAMVVTYMPAMTFTAFAGQDAAGNHICNFSYSGKANVITASCTQKVTGSSYCPITGKKENGTAKLTLVKPADADNDNVVPYGENAAVTMTKDTAWTNYVKQNPDVYYVGVSGTSYDSSTTVPEEAGSYQASVTVDKATATLNFSIAAPAVYTVTYDPGDATGDATLSGMPNPDTYPKSDTATISSAVPTRTGYVFNGWKDSQGTEYKANDTYIEKKDITLYAQWTANTYTVTLNANGGSVTPTSIEVTYGETYAALPTATKAGSVFAGWFTAADGGDEVKTTDTVEITSGTELFAHWDATKYTITFDANGGKWADDATTKDVDTEENTDETKAIEEFPTNPSQDGYKFKGWFTAADGGDAVTAKTFSSDTTVFAQWVEKETVTLGVTLDGWTYGGSTNTPNVTGEPEGETAVITYAVKDGAAVDTPVNAGTYVVTATLAETDDHKAATATAEFTIEKKEIGLSWGTAEFTYDGDPKTLTVEATDLVGDDTVELTVTGNVETDADDRYEAEVTGLDNDNYKLPSVTTKAWKINKATPEVTVTGASDIDYGQTLADSTISGETGGVEGTFAWVVPTTTPEAGENQSFDCEFNPTDGVNYKSVTGLTANLTVKKVDWTITAEATQTFTYGDDSAAVLATCDAPLGYELKDGDDVIEEVDTVTGAFTIKKAGLAIVVVHVDPDKNHNETTKDITITINKKTIDKPTADSTTFVFTGEELTYNPTGFDDETMDIADNKKTDAGTYTVTVTPKDNYTWSGDCTFSWTIAKADYAEAVKTLAANLKPVNGATVTVNLPTLPTGASYGTPKEQGVKNTISYSFNKTEKKLTATAANKAEDGQSFDYVIPVVADKNHNDYEITVTFTIANHKHGSYTYSASGNVLTATCGAEGCDEPAYAITMTLGFDGFTDGKVEYTGSAINATTTLSDGSATTPVWPVEPAPTAVYTADGKTLDSAPTDCGAYTVSITQGTATATLNYEIVHTHSWAYATDDTDKNVINVTCDSPAEKGCPDSYATTLTVDAEGKTYDGEAVEATVEKADNWDDTIAEYTLSYEKKDSEGAYVAMSDGEKPTDAGDYKAVITLGGATAYVEFTIDKAEIDMPTFPQEDGEDKVYTYNGEEQTFEPEGFDGDTMTLSENTTQTYAGTYAVTVTPKANYKWSASGDCEFTWEIAQRVVSIEWGEEDTFTYKDQSTSYEMTFTLGNVVEGDEVNATVEGNVKTNSGKYTAKITELDNDNYALPETGLTKKWTINKAAIKMPTADTTEFVYNGEEQEYKPVGFDPDTMTIAGNKATTAKENRLCGVNPKSNYQWEEGRVDCEFTWTINKADIDYDAPYAVMGLVFTDSEQELINAGEVRPFGTDDLTMEYSLSEDDDYTDDATAIKGTDAGDYTVWYKIDGGDNYNDVKDSITVTIDGLDPTFTTEPAANTGLEYTGDAQALVTEGKAKNGTVEYQIGEAVDDEAWGDYDSIKVTDAGDYTVWYRIAGDKNYNNTEPQSIEVSIEKVDSTLDVAPVEKSGLIYNGKAQALVTAGVATGGTVMYSINGGGWTDTATGINHGEYSVTYYVKGDKNHNDIAATGDALIVNIARNHISGVKLSYTKYTYNGKVHTPSATVTDVNKKTLKKGTDYTVSVGKSNKKPGTYKVVVKGIGNYSGSITKSYKIAVKTPTISKLARLSKSFKITVKKLSSTYVTGYQLRYSTSSKMTNAKTVTIGTKNTVVSKTVKNLKAKKKYYVQVRAYKTISGKKYASAWGTAKTVTTK